MKKTWFTLILALLFMPLWTVSAYGDESDHETCFACHGEKGAEAPFVKQGSFGRSVHGALSCSDCHEGFKEFPHPDKPPRVQCATCHEEKAGTFRKSHHGKFWEDVAEPAACLQCHGDAHNLLSSSHKDSPINRLNLPQTCGKCHESVVGEFLQSVHGTAMRKGVKEAPDCTSCHGEHQFLGPLDADSPVSKARVPDTCSQCHGSLALAGQLHLDSTVAKTYQGGYHGVALQAGVTKAANCASCHGVHNIYPSSDPRSSVNPANLAHTCAECHPGAGPGVTQGRIHQNPRDTAKGTPVGFVKWIYVWMILLVVGGMAAHNGLDFVWKLTHPGTRLYPESFYTEERFVKVERVQHALLAASFILLVYTGFAHTWPKSWWNAPFALLSNGADWRRWLHLGAAAVLVGAGIFHVFFLAFTQRGRSQLKALLPSFDDLKDLLGRLSFLLGRSPVKPAHRHFSYIEKAEYWALVWGTVIMGLTGVLVVFRDWSLAHIPKVIIDVALAIHFWEAVLATLAIVVWHFYWVLWDPDVYPMNWSWLTGKPRRKPPKK